MRTFIAIELPEEIKDQLARLEDKLKSAEADVKWVEAKNIHLTLKFLGEIDNKKLEDIVSILDKIAKNNSSFYACISSIGAFPRISSPRVIWLGIDKGDIEIKKIAAALGEEGEKIGIPKEDRHFSSHITIGRTKSGYNLDKLAKELKVLESNLGMKLEFAVKKITLFKSTLSPKGPTYEVLKAASLKTI